VPASEATLESDVMRFSPPNFPGEIIIGSMSGAYIGFEQVDLTGVTEVKFMASAPSQGLPTAGGVIEIHRDAPDGPLLGTSEPIVPSPGFGNMKAMKAPITPSESVLDLYFVFRNEDAPDQQPLFILNAVEFAAE
jgi:cytochrome c